MDPESIRSLQNPRVKNLVRLREGGHRRRQGKFLIEGRRELERAIDAGVLLEELFYCPERFRDESDEELLGLSAGAGARLIRVAPDVFDKASLREGPDGLLAVTSTWERPLEDMILGSNPLLLVVESVEKPGNLGALMRSAGAAGVDALVVTDPVVDIFSPNVIRASQGVCFDIQVAVAANADALAWMSRNGVRPVATTLDARLPHWDIDLQTPSAIVMGSEKDGLSEFWLTADIERAKIPMQGMADSLNVSAAAAVFLFEAVRQRQTRGS